MNKRRSSANVSTYWFAFCGGKQQFSLNYGVMLGKLLICIHVPSMYGIKQMNIFKYLLLQIGWANILLSKTAEGMKLSALTCPFR